MHDITFRYIGVFALLLSATATLILAVGSSSKSFDPVLIIGLLWTVSPYLGLIIGDFVIRKIAVVPQMSVVLCGVSILMLFFTLYAYIEARSSRSSTAGLAFVFIPLYLNVITILLVVVGLVWAVVIKSSKLETSANFAKIL